MKDLFDTEEIYGLRETEASYQLLKDGPNALPGEQSISWFQMIWRVLSEPMLLLLVAASALYFLFGDLLEAMILGFSVFAVIGLTFYQERKTEHALAALRDLSSPRALVIRDGQTKRIAGRDVVCGDIVILNEGDRVPADAEVLQAIHLLVDESLLTGESEPVRKLAQNNPLLKQRPGGQDSPWVYSGTLVVRGKALVRVFATGTNTEMGKIGKVLETVEVGSTPLQRQTGRLVIRFALVSVLLCLLLALSDGVLRGFWKEGLLAGITLSMSMIPEEIPVVITVFFALGAWRLSKFSVLTRRIPILETLGSATVLCVDKTGTLTENRMHLAALFSEGFLFSLPMHPAGESLSSVPEPFHELLEFALLSSQKDPIDPMESSIHQTAQSLLKNTEHLHQNWSFIREYPLSKELLALSKVWKEPNGNQHVIAAKGAPEAISDLCHVSEELKKEIFEHVQKMSDQGLRVLAVAKASFEQSLLPEIQHDFEFKFVGLLGFIDPIRKSVPDAIRQCQAAGIRVLMITGDYAGTAQFIGQKIGLQNPDLVMSGDEIESLDDLSLLKQLRKTSIFARMVPEQKLRLVELLQKDQEIVAMTGDGVNDAPALKAADIGIAMGERGTDVAREAASLVLLKDDFASIVVAVRLGRRIFDNLKKAFLYVLAVHVPIAGLSLFPILLGFPLMLLPIHVVLLELIIDPACSMVFESQGEDADLMKRKPRDPLKPLFSRRLILFGLLQGVFSLVAIFVVFLWAHFEHKTETELRTLSFVTLVITNVGLILVNRAQSLFSSNALVKNRALGWILLFVLVWLVTTLFVGPLREFFRFSMLSLEDAFRILSVFLLFLVACETLKRLVKI